MTAMTVMQAARLLNVSPSTIRRWARAGILEQVPMLAGNPGQWWRFNPRPRKGRPPIMLITEMSVQRAIENRPPMIRGRRHSRVVETGGPGIPVNEAARALGVSRQAIYQAVSRGRLMVAPGRPLQIDVGSLNEYKRTRRRHSRVSS